MNQAKNKIVLFCGECRESEEWKGKKEGKSIIWLCCNSRKSGEASWIKVFFLPTNKSLLHCVIRCCKMPSTMSERGQSGRGEETKQFKTCVISHHNKVAKLLLLSFLSLFHHLTFILFPFFPSLLLPLRKGLEEFNNRF